MTDYQRIAELILKHLRDELNHEDAGELNTWIGASGENQQVFSELTNPASLNQELLEFYESKNRIYEKVIEALPKPKLISMRNRWKAWVAAAAVILLIGSYFMFFNQTGKNEPIATTQQERFKNDVNPGSFKARLQLADGSLITLDSAGAGVLTKQGGTVVINKDGQLVYSGGGSEVLYNTVSTANGETYTMTLADGSKVWLNSGSSIHFPVAFPGKERRIEVTGEVYVKVAKNAAQPFIASTNGMEVQALGTEFNINSYPDEASITATLIEGSVKVNSSITLKPGQQTGLTGGKLSAARPVNIDEITAWKDGFFHFESADLKTVLRQFARWYNIEVVYEGPVTQDRFFVIVNRSSTLATVLKALQTGGVKFIIDGKKLIVKST